MSKIQKRFLLLALFLFGVALLFLPVRVDHISGIIQGTNPSNLKVVATSEDYYCSVFVGFNGHPVGIVGLIFFALMPFFIVAQSFSVSRPFSFMAITLLRLQALLMFIGGPYVWYMITYQHGYFSNTTHDTSPAIAGWILISYVIVSGMLLFAMIANPKGKLAKLFDED